MKVTLVASTTIEQFPESIRSSKFVQRDRVIGDARDADVLGEFAGRACYQAWELANPKTANNQGYLDNIISQGHFSVLEHSSVTFYIEGVSRSLTHELIRHRHLSYSELSQRYVDVENAPIVTPPAIRDGDSVTRHLLDDAVDDTRPYYASLVQELEAGGLSRKRAREAARAVMPNAIETKIVVTGNLRAWRDFLFKRDHEAADAEIRELAAEILKQLREVAPNSFQDIPEVPFS